jgi:hypothetical protein
MGGSGGSKRESRLARDEEQQRQGRVREGTARVNTIFDSQFNENFFDQRKKAFTNYAAPQVEDQYGDAQEQLTYALARGGNLNSSTRADKVGDLQKQYDLNMQKVADQALSSATESRNAVEDARGNLINTVTATGDAQGAANSALARASALSQPQAFSPLSQLFADFTSGLGQQAALERSAALGSPFKPRYDTGLFGAGANSIKVQK